MRTPSSIFLRFLILFFFIVTILLNLNLRNEQQFSYLAESFLEGKLYFLEKPGSWYDSTMFDGKVYWPLGLSPVIILMPFVALFKAFGAMFYQGYLQLFLTVGIFIMCYKLALKYKYKRDDALWLGFAFCFASVYLFVAFVPWVWNFSHAVTVFFLFLSIIEWHGKKRYWIIGICLGIAMAARFTAVFGALFFLADLWFPKKKSPLRDRAVCTFQIFVPIVVSGLSLLWYNYARFGDPFVNGYMTMNNWLMPKEKRFETLNYGLFQLRNIPMNIYYYFLKTLDPVRVEHFTEFGQTFVLKPPYVKLTYPGTSFFVAAPIFLYIFRAIRKKLNIREVWMSLIPTVVILCILMPYYWPGWRQIGPRYTLDFLPFTYLILLHSFEKNKLSTFAKVLITCSAILNFYLFYYAVTTPI